MGRLLQGGCLAFTSHLVLQEANLSLLSRQWGGEGPEALRSMLRT